MAESEPSQIKAALRRAALQRRDGLDAPWRARASAAITAAALALPDLDTGPVSGFWPIRSEIDCRDLLWQLHERGLELCLPVVDRGRQVFRRWTPGDALESRGFGLSEPPDTAPIIDPRVCLVPLAAFDRRGGRLGYGKGYYDQALGDLSRHGHVTAIGLAFSVQEVDRVPVEPHDQLLDLIITEREVVRPAASPHGLRDTPTI
ncbi:5-formyltetrahydrofolate cyclo-ligase [Microvirga massiliensis]|uniref:5-formyltetrahydrofolate cyclo-ligase n=1 Tax=Microvirga massiliensis TaxID=1033741 RepID=UPI00062B9628|nr:5-formyltetrahydrofolate cyclo-ligase [Microvirga massiliensis]